MTRIIDLHCDFHYEAAHWLPHVAPDHQCHRMHGHSYRLTVTIRGPIQPDGFVTDFATIKTIVGKTIDQLDHTCLNDLIPNPTCELQLAWICDEIAARLPLLHRLTLRETATNSATLEAQ